MFQLAQSCPEYLAIDSLLWHSQLRLRQLRDGEFSLGMLPFHLLHD